MHDAAVISGSLVDAKNVNSHKCMRLIIDVPAERALEVIAAFGWPTMVNPVSVAVARLIPEAANRKDGEAPATGSTERRAHEATSQSDRITRSVTTPRPSVVPASAAGADSLDIQVWLDGRKKSPAQIAGYLCTLPLFHAFLRQKFTAQWNGNWHVTSSDQETAKQCVYDICTVTSRTQLTDKNIEWNALLLAFRLWENHPELEDA